MVQISFLDTFELAPLVFTLQSLLSVEERARSEAFRLPLARREFIVGRAVLRLLLAERLEVPPREIGFCYGPQGRPALDDGARNTEIGFNVAHSHGIVALALAKAATVGIDLEWVDMEADVAGMAAAWSIDAGREVQALGSARERGLAFFERWVRFEANRKYAGSGIFFPQVDSRSGHPDPAVEHMFSTQAATGHFVGCVAAPSDMHVAKGTWLTRVNVQHAIRRYTA